MRKRQRLRAADLFCGAGGFTTGAESSGRVDVVLAINHWRTAICTHQANHPGTRHICARIDDVDPRHDKSLPELDLLMASPECTHHSNARGGQPVDDQKRATPWHVCIWTEAKHPQWLLLENVREFRDWGPLIQRRDKRGRPMLKPDCRRIPSRWPLENAWLGVSVENEWNTDRIPKFLAVPAALHFVSFEPLLSPIRAWRCPDCGAHASLRTAGRCLCVAKNRIDWAIAGGESQAGARPCHPAWVRGLRDDCRQAEIPFFFKQWGEWAPRSQMPEARSEEWGSLAFNGYWSPLTTPFHGHDDDGEGLHEALMIRVGKKTAGMALDGQISNEFPGERE